MTAALDLQLPIAELFLSVQGEGPSLGHPAHFLRLQGCSVGCHWCDTKYTWDFERGESRSLADVEQELDGLGAADLLVITGGEPLEFGGVADLLTWAGDRWKRVEVETSGLLEPPPTGPGVRWNWSPKLSSVTPKSDQTWSHASAFVAAPDAICKVVVDDQADWAEAKERIAEAAMPRERVYIMPQGMKPEDLRERARWLAPLCIAEGFRLTTRMHVEIWGARRGV